jgi:hypothetical protein
VSLVGRFAQGLSAIHPRLPPDRDMILIESLSPAQRMAFLALPAYDQPHLCTVYRTLRSSGEMDADLLQAALLHDIGKVAIGGRVRLFDRVLLVVLGVSSPRLLEKQRSYLLAVGGSDSPWPTTIRVSAQNGQNYSAARPEPAG